MKLESESQPKLLECKTSRDNLRIASGMKLERATVSHVSLFGGIWFHYGLLGSGFPISVQFHLLGLTLPFRMNRKWRKCGCFCYCCVWINCSALKIARPTYSKLGLPCLAFETNASENNAELAFAATWNTKRSQIKFVSRRSAETARNMEMSQRAPVPPRTRAGRLRNGGDRERGKVALPQFECAMTDTYETEPIDRERFTFDVRSVWTERLVYEMYRSASCTVCAGRARMMSATADRKWIMEYEICCKLHSNEGFSD